MAPQRPRDNESNDSQLNQQVTDLAAALFGAEPTTEKTVLYKPPPRQVIVDGKWQTYTGAGIVDARGNLVSENFYDLSVDAGAFYQSFSPAKLATVTDTLFRKGFYRSGQPGDPISDINAIANLLDYSNIFGRDYNWSLVNLEYTVKDQQTVGRGGDGSRTYRVSSADDLKLVAKRISAETLGRELSDAEADYFAKAYQQQELQFQKSAAGGGTVVEPAAPDVEAQKFAQAVAPTEANAYKYLGYVNKLFSSVGSV
jgi:hypothetical protein